MIVTAATFIYKYHHAHYYCKVVLFCRCYYQLLLCGISLSGLFASWTATETFTD